MSRTRPGRIVWVCLSAFAGLLFSDTGLLAGEQTSPDTLLLKDFRPKSVYRIPETLVQKARYPVIDMHAHVYAKTPEQIAEWIRVMDQAGVEKAIVMTGATGKEFDDTYALYAGHPDRFEV